MRQDSPLISIIVPIYNIRDYVGKCIESIANQTYRNLEIILVDDGSTDGSGELCDRYAVKDDRILILHKMNGGLSDARNHGIDICHGRYIGFVDGDDWIHPQMYEMLYRALLNDKSDIACCSFEREDSGFASQRYDIANFGGTRTVSRCEVMSKLYAISSTAWNKLYKRELFDDIRYPIGKLCEDEYVIHELLWKCNRISVLEEKLYFYTRRSGSITGTISAKRIEDSLNAFEKRLQFVEEHTWNDALIPAIRQYCDYCIIWYFELQKQSGVAYRPFITLLYMAEKNMVMHYRKMHIGLKYVVFIKSPEIYARLRRGKKKVRELIMKKK